MKIMIVMHPALGPIISSLRIARILVSKGHQVIYMVPVKNTVLSEFILAQGFEYFSYLEAEKKNVTYINQIFEKVAPDYLVLDADQLIFAIILFAKGAKIIILNTVVMSDKQKLLPPFCSSIIPSDTLWSRLKIECVWANIYFRKRLYNIYNFFLSKNKQQDKCIAVLTGFPFDNNTCHKRSYLYSLKNYPEYFVYPKEFDFKMISAKGKYYLGPMVDSERKEQPFDWSQIENNNPIIYCSMGTIPSLYYRNYLSFLKKVIHIFEKNPNYNLILSYGDLSADDAPTSSFQNIFIFQSVPQLQILKQCHLMISHAGLNSIKESILFGVPIMAYPLSPYTDQQGNAARIVYHGLGKRGNIKSDSEIIIEKDVFSTLHDNRIKQEVEKMKLIFEKYAANEEDTIERMLEISY